MIGTVLFPLFKLGMSESNAWRSICAVPATITIIWSIAILFISDDGPKGNYDKLQRTGAMKNISAATSFFEACKNINTWFLFLQYGCCFGVEVTMNNAAAMHFKETFGQSVESAAAIASIFGFMNLFARGLGGWASDRINKNYSMRGRLWVQMVLMIFEGAFIIVFSHTKDLTSAIIAMTVFSVFTQACEGSTYSIVPYIDTENTGSIAGIVGAGGNFGAVCFGLVFRNAADDKDAFEIMGTVVIACSILSLFTIIKGHRGIIWGMQDDNRVSIKFETRTFNSVPNEKEEQNFL